MPTPRSTREHYREQQALTASAVLAVREAWSTMGSNFDGSWRSVLARMLTIFGTAQGEAARSSVDYVPAVLDELGIDAPAAGRLIPESFVGVASDGRPLDTLLSTSVIRAKQAVADGASTREALTQGRAWLEWMAQTQVADAERAATQTGLASRPGVGGYVRMLNPPSCSRCVVLAGRFYRWNKGFLRHPACDCRHVPCQEDMADDLRTDPRKYFDSLTEAEQDKAFTKSGAEAIRLGSDISQVVNARRGMFTAGESSTTTRMVDVRKKDGSIVREERVVNVSLRRAETVDLFGQQVFATTEGMTRRGAFGGTNLKRGKRKLPVRLMPETILAQAKGREDAVRLLKLYGFIT